MAIPLQRHDDPNVPCPLSLREGEHVEKRRQRGRKGAFMLLLISTWDMWHIHNYTLSLNLYCTSSSDSAITTAHPFIYWRVFIECEVSRVYKLKITGSKSREDTYSRMSDHGHVNSDINCHPNITKYHYWMLPSPLSICILNLFEHYRHDIQTHQNALVNLLKIKW